MENVGAEADVPFRVAKDGIELTKRGVTSFIAPSKASVLEVHLL